MDDKERQEKDKEYLQFLLKFDVARALKVVDYQTS